MTRITIALGAFLASTTAFAADMSSIDANGDGMISVEEFAAAYPDVDPSTFAAVDVNADGLISADELATATGEGGLLAG